MSKVRATKETPPLQPSQSDGWGGFYKNLPDGTQKLIYKPNRIQLNYHQRTEPNVLLYGNRGGGKSICGRMDAHLRAMLVPGFKYCILRRTFPELRKSHLVHVPGEMEMFGGWFNKQENTAYYPNGSIGFFSHCQSDEDVLKLLSAEFYLMFFDELSTFEWDMFTKLSTSCRVPSGSGLTAMVRAATNPLGVSAEDIFHYFVEKDVPPEEDADYDPADWYAIKIGAEDNEHLDTEQYQKRFSGMTAHVKKAWVDGEFSMEDALFDFKPTVRITDSHGDVVTSPYHVVDRVEMDKILKYGQFYRAYDHGYSPDPAYCLWIAHLGSRYIVLHEKLWYKTIAADIAKEMKQITEELGIPRVVTTFADPSIDLQTGADIHTIKDTFENNGVPIELSVNSRELYASAIHTALAQEIDAYTPKLQIYSKGCPYLVKTLPKQRYDPKHPLRMANSKTDHAAIALAYFLISTASGERGTLQGGLTNQKPWMREKAENRWVLGAESVKKGY